MTAKADERDKVSAWGKTKLEEMMEEGCKCHLSARPVIASAGGSSLRSSVCEYCAIQRGWIVKS